MRLRSLAGALISMVLAVGSAPESQAKPPALTGLFPSGAARGQSLSVAMSGTFDNWPVDVRVEGAGLSVKPDEKKGTLLIEVAADARPGVHWIGVHDKEGATSLRPFIVGSLPELVEAEPNDDPRKPQTIDAPRVVINGRLAKSGDVDGFAVTLESGQILAADLEANRNLGSPMDAVLQVVSTDGFVLEQNDDAVGRDPRILFHAPAAGTYVVRLFAFPAQPDSSIRFSGSDAYVYRLTLTTGGFIEHAFPLAVAPESSADIRAFGPNIAEADAVLDVPADDPIGPPTLTSASLAGSAEVRRVDGPAAVEVEPNDQDNPQEIPARGWVSGRIDPPGDRDAYRIALKKGDKRVIQAESRALGLPLDAVIKVLGADGKTLAENDDARRTARDPSLTFTAPADGEFRIVVADLYGRGSPNHAYLLGVTVPEPDFAVSLAADVFTLTPGVDPIKIVVAIDRKNGHKGEIEVTADDLPEGVSATKAVSKPEGDSAKSVTIELRAEGSAAKSGPFRVIARPVDGKTPERAAPAKIAGFEVETQRPWLAVLPKPGS